MPLTARTRRRATLRLASSIQQPSSYHGRSPAFMCWESDSYQLYLHPRSIIVMKHLETNVAAILSEKAYYLLNIGVATPNVPPHVSLVEMGHNSGEGECNEMIFQLYFILFYCSTLSSHVSLSKPSISEPN